MMKKLLKMVALMGLMAMLSIISLEKGIIIYDALELRNEGVNDMKLKNEGFRYDLTAYGDGFTRCHTYSIDWGWFIGE